MFIKSLTLLAAILATSASTSAFARVNVIKVCNHRAEPIWATYAKKEWNAPFWSFSDNKSSGWFRFEPGQCLDLVTNLKGYFSLYAKNQNADWTSENSFALDENLKRGWICVTNGVFKDAYSSHCGTEKTPGYREVQGHTFDFMNARNYNVYEIRL